MPPERAPLTPAAELAKKVFESGAKRLSEGELLAVRRGKCVLVQYPYFVGSIQSIHLVAFPDPRHFDTFKEATKATLKGGNAYNQPPSELEPNAVGTLSAQVLDGGLFVLEFAQSHYFTDDEIRNRFNKWSDRSGSDLPRSLHTRYAGWRERAFRELFRIVARDGRELRVSHLNLRRLAERDFLRAAEESKAVVEKIEHGGDCTKNYPPGYFFRYYSPARQRGGNSGTEGGVG